MFIIAGYLAGSVLFAPMWGRVFTKKDIIEHTKDHNPGTANAFMQGGFGCGVATLICDMAKGFLPVFLCIHLSAEYGLHSAAGMAFVMLAPVVGHNFPLYTGFKGGKGIATSFGVLLGFYPDLKIALTLAIWFILFSLVIRITPHYYRTISTYAVAMICVIFGGFLPEQKLGFIMISIAVCVRMHLSDEKREECKVRLLWKH